MASRPCEREAETIRAAWAPGGAAGAGAELDAAVSAHLAECPSCAEIAALARLFRDERAAALAGAHPPSAGLVWWRAQRRARLEAAQRAARPIAVVHGIALGVAGAAAAAVLALGAGSFRAVFTAASGLFSSAELPTLALPELAAVPTAAVVIAGIASLILAPVAIYLALGEK